MSPWSRAEPEDEASDRDLFARRARAFEPGSVPSLASVLDAVDRSREKQESRRARGRALVGMALAAACVAAAVTSFPRSGMLAGTRDAIAADLDGGATSIALGNDLAGEACERQDARNETRAVVAMSTEPPACYAPPAAYTLSTRYETNPEPVCTPNESCSVAAPMSY